MPVSALLVYEWQKLKEPFSFARFLPLLLGVWAIVVAQIPESVLFSLNAGDPTAHPIPSWPGTPWLPSSTLFTLLLVFFFVEGMIRYRPDRPVVEEVGRRFLGVVYCALPLTLLLEIRVAEHGRWLVCFLFLTIWATDIGAYFVGRRWGKHKLAPQISPGKTLEGFWGGIVFASAMGGGLTYGFPLPFGGLEATLLGGALAVVGQAGDLAESLLKREAGVKDSSQLIPGHGGFLDRLDSLLFAAPAFHLFLWLHLSFVPKEW